jgi:hypothetical protein
MNLRRISLGLIFCLVVSVMCFAADSATVGTWKLNEAKSKIPAGAPKNTTVTYTADGDQYKGSIDGVDGKGNPVHSEWTGKFDGKDYAVTGDPNVDMRSIKETTPGHYSVANKKDGKTITTGTIVVSKDGKTRTLTTHTTDAKGKKISATYIYERQ